MSIQDHEQGTKCASFVVNAYYHGVHVCCSAPTPRPEDPSSRGPLWRSRCAPWAAPDLHPPFRCDARTCMSSIPHAFSNSSILPLLPRLSRLNNTRRPVVSKAKPRGQQREAATRNKEPGKLSRAVRDMICRSGIRPPPGRGLRGEGTWVQRRGGDVGTRFNSSASGSAPCFFYPRLCVPGWETTY